jgi:hypothetical protein
VQSLLIGGLITLIGTILVQILIIPSVQRRTRKRERWERDITELQTLMENESRGTSEPCGGPSSPTWRFTPYRRSAAPRL